MLFFRADIKVSKQHLKYEYTEYEKYDKRKLLKERFSTYLPHFFLFWSSNGKHYVFLTKL